MHWSFGFHGCSSEPSSVTFSVNYVNTVRAKNIADRETYLRAICPIAVTRNCRNLKKLQLQRNGFFWNISVTVIFGGSSVIVCLQFSRSSVAIWAHDWSDSAQRAVIPTLPVSPVFLRHDHRFLRKPWIKLKSWSTWALKALRKPGCWSMCALEALEKPLAGSLEMLGFWTCVRALESPDSLDFGACAHWKT